MKANQEKFSKHISDILKENKTGDVEALYSWRMYCYEKGANLIDLLENSGCEIKGKKVLDCAGGWGGHALSFLDVGAEVFLSDYNDHSFSRLRKNLDSSSFQICQADCMRLPYQDESFDIILALELIEHIQDQNAFADEISRLLKPGGVCILSTPSKLRSVFRGEDHYNIKYIALLPLKIQKLVAEKIFKKNYPFAITEQFVTSSSALKPFKERGLNLSVLLSKNKESLSSKFPLIGKFMKEFLWSYMLVRK